MLRKLLAIMDPKRVVDVDESEDKNWEQISLPKALTTCRDETHVAHCMLWFRTTESHNAFAFLQLRFD
ncbi:unnamed protein product, partial [Oppiella nova]